MSAHILAPRGRQLFSELPLELLALPKLLSYVGNGLLTASQGDATAMLLIYDGDITAAMWSPGGGVEPITGQAAVRLIDEMPGTTPITAEALDGDVVRILPMLWSDIPFTPRIRVGHLVDLAAFVNDQVTSEHKEQMVAISIESKEHYGASLYQRGRHLLSYTDEGPVANAEELITRFSTENNAYVGIQVAELSRAWLPLQPPVSWAADSLERTSVVAKPMPAATEGVNSPAQSPARLVLEPVETDEADPSPFESVAADENPLAFTAELGVKKSESQAEAPSREDLDALFRQLPRPAQEENPFLPTAPPQPPMEPIRLGDIADLAATPEPPKPTTPGFLPFGNDTDEDTLVEASLDAPPIRPSLPNLLDMADIEDEARSRSQAQSDQEDTDDILQTPLSSVMVKISALTQRQMPEFAAAQILNELREMKDHGATLEDAIRETSNRPIKGITQTQLDNLVASWTDSYVTNN